MLGYQPLPIVVRETLLIQVQFTHISIFGIRKTFVLESPDNPVLLESSKQNVCFYKSPNVDALGSCYRQTPS